eukprot:EG_transcript_40887
MVQGKAKLNSNKKAKVKHTNAAAKTRKGAPAKGTIKNLNRRRLDQMVKKQAGRARADIERHIASRMSSNEKDSLKLLKAPGDSLAKAGGKKVILKKNKKGHK